MIKYQISLKPTAEKELKKLTSRDKKRVLLALIDLSHDPFEGKKLEGNLKSLYTVRVWPHRIIYKIYKKESLVIVIKIGHRQNIYK